MTRIFWHGLFITVAAIAAVICAPAGARAAGCTVNSPISDLVAGYNPFAGATATLTIASGTVSVTCSHENNVVVKVFVSGASAGYTTPFLTYGPNGFALQYTMCVPGTSPCNSGTNVWNTTTGFYSYTTPANNGNNTQLVPSFQISLAQQDAPYGTTSQYTGNLFFTTTCGGVAC